jgi:hypothetical protein
MDRLYEKQVDISPMEAGNVDVDELVTSGLVGIGDNAGEGDDPPTPGSLHVN